MSKDPYTIIKRPIVTEKSMTGGAFGKYTFEVDRGANKIEIAEAVETIFKKNVLKVNTISVKGKKKRVRYRMGRTPDWKKAIVTLQPGQTIDLFEGM